MTAIRTRELHSIWRPQYVLIIVGSILDELVPTKMSALEAAGHMLVRLKRPMP
jgi:hypothetical protein